MVGRVACGLIFVTFLTSSLFARTKGITVVNWDARYANYTPKTLRLECSLTNKDESDESFVMELKQTKKSFYMAQWKGEYLIKNENNAKKKYHKVMFNSIIGADLNLYAKITVRSRKIGDFSVKGDWHNGLGLALPDFSINCEEEYDMPELNP